MREMTVRKLLVIVVAMLAISSLVGCARIAGVAKDDYRDGQYYPICLVDMDRAVNDARMAGKDKQCPNEFNAVKEMADKAIKTHLACNTDGACKMAKDVAAKARANVVFPCPGWPASR